MRKSIATVLSLAALGLFLGACGLAPQAATSTGADGGSVVLQPQDLSEVVDASGTLAPIEETRLGFATGGEVAQVFAELGDEVAEGQALALLDTRDLSLQLEMSQSSADSAQSGLRVAGTSYADLAAGPSADQIAQAEVNVDKAKDQRWGNQAQRDAVCGRVDKGFAQQADCDQAEANVLAAEDSVRLAELQLQELLGGASDAELSQAREQIDQARSQAESAEAQVAQARLRLEQATLSSPIAGTVTALDLRAGELAGGQAGVTVSDLSQLEVEVALDERDVADLALGQPARVSVDALPELSLEGEVVAISPTADTSSGVARFPVTIRVAELDERVRAGMSASVKIVTNVLEDAYALPLKAVTSRDGVSTVRVLEAGAEGESATREVEVTLGRTVGDRVQVLEGLETGDRVLLEEPAAPERGGGFGPFGGGR